VSVSREAARGAEDFPDPSNINEGVIIMSMDSLKDLYIDELKDLYNAENQLVKALPKMAKKASAPETRFSGSPRTNLGACRPPRKDFQGVG
jgi:hypothetical protein